VILLVLVLQVITWLEFWSALNTWIYETRYCCYVTCNNVLSDIYFVFAETRDENCGLYLFILLLGRDDLTKAIIVMEVLWYNSEITFCIGPRVIRIRFKDWMWIIYRPTFGCFSPIDLIRFYCCINREQESDRVWNTPPFLCGIPPKICKWWKKSVSWYYYRGVKVTCLTSCWC
jgi:hypothetical protein